MCIRWTRHKICYFGRWRGRGRQVWNSGRGDDRERRIATINGCFRLCSSFTLSWRWWWWYLRLKIVIVSLNLFLHSTESEDIPSQIQSHKHVQKNLDLVIAFVSIYRSANQYEYAKYKLTFKAERRVSMTLFANISGVDNSLVGGSIS